MTGPSERDEIAADRDALAALLAALDEPGQRTATYAALAKRILASDWLAERDRRTAAKTLREAAEHARAVEQECREVTLPTEYDRGVADAWEAVADGLRDRADQIEADQ